MDYKIIEVKQSIFEDNDADAERLRQEIKKENTYLINLMSSPGSGKTTTLCRTINGLKDEMRIGVMEADIDSDVDAATVTEAGARAIQIHTGGMCHLDADMTRQGLMELGTEDLDLVILENVGNLVCPAEFDTGAVRNMTILSVPEGEVLAGDMPGRQLRNAQTFIDMRTEELMLNWKLCMEGKDVVWVDPIR